MVRRREFDPEEALGRAMELFWRQGYATTSVEDLVEQTGVARAGLYKVFGDKRGLFEAALSRYVDENIGDMFCDLETPEATVRDVEVMFMRVVATARAGRLGRGCFFVNTSVEMNSDAGEVGKIVTQTLERQRSALQSAIERSLAAGETRPDLDPEQSASWLLATLFGMATLGRAGASADIIENAARAALTQLH